MIDWLLEKLADRLGVASPSAGEAISPRIRFDQPWPQWLLVLTALGSVALVIWLYRRETGARPGYRMILAGLRIGVILLAMFMLSEAVLSVERTGLPYLTILIDDSASGRIADQYADPKIKAGLDALVAKGRARGVASETTIAPTSRLELARALLLRDDAKLIRELERQHKVRIYRVSTAARLLAKVDRTQDVPRAVELVRGLEPGGAESRLGDALKQVLTELRGAPPSAMVLLSDGRTTDGESLTKAAEGAARKGVPIYAVGLGSAEPARDVELGELLVDDVVFVDDAVRFQVKVSARGFASDPLRLRLKERDPSSADPKAERELESIEIPAPLDGQPRKVELIHRPRTTGTRGYIVEVDPLPRELQTANNRIERTVVVRKEKLKVLLVDGEPRYEYRYVKNYLERDETIDLSVVLLSSDPEYSDQDRSALPTFPASKEDLHAYDVVLLGDADTGFLSQTQMTNLVTFVTEKGGGVLFIAGDLYNPLSYKGTPLELLLPFELSDARNPTAAGPAVPSFRPELTLEGRASPIFRFGDDDASSTRVWLGLPELYWYFEAPRKKPAALVLAEHPTAMGSDGKLPLVLYQFVGAGKSMFHAFDDTWRWRFRTGDQYFGRFWVQTVRFLARSRLAGQRQAELQTDRRRYERGKPIEFRARFPNPALAPGGDLTVEVARGGQGSRKITLKLVPGSRNVFEGVLPQAAEGDYEARLLPPPVLEGPIPTTSFRVEAPVGEFEHIEMNQAELMRVAEATGGKYYSPLAVETLLGDLPKPSKVPLDTDPPITLWNSWPVFTLFLILITLEWVLRKRRQMV